MRVRGLSELTRTQHYLPIAIALIFTAMGDSISGPYFALFITDKAQLSPLELGTLLTVRAVMSIGIGYAFGRWFDRKPSVVPLILALSMGIVGYLAISFTTNFYGLLAIIAVPMATGACCFPQLFALAKGHLDQSDPITAERGVSFLRALWSVAWAIGPAIGAAVILPFDFQGLFLTTVLSAAIALAIVLGARIRATARATPAAPKRESRFAGLRAAGSAAAALTLFHMAMFVGSVALSVGVTHDMGGAKQDVGHAYSLCAFLEVFVMMKFVLWPVNPSSRAWLSVGFIAFAAYFLVVAIWPTVNVVLAAQAIRAVGIGVVGCLGIGYAQSVLRGRVGAAAALFANSVNAGLFLSGIFTGVWAHAFGYQSMFGACAALCGLGLLALQFQPRPPPRELRHGL